MNYARVIIIIILFFVTLLITNFPKFHLGEYFGMDGTRDMDMISHAVFYFVMCIVTLLLFQNSKISRLASFVLWVLPAILEFTQAFVPGRTVSFFDMIGNYLGIVSGLLIYLLVKQLQKTKNPESKKNGRLSER